MNSGARFYVNPLPDMLYQRKASPPFVGREKKLKNLKNHF
jgi:hypothetical protein